jgi:uncharacterized protein (TIGR00255 family)
MKSMTGYGKDTIFTDDYNIVVEVKSVNNRFLDLNIFFPRELISLELILKKLFKNKIFRGKFEVKIDVFDKRIPTTVINEPKLKSYSELIKKAAKISGFDINVNLQDLISYPEMLISDFPDNDKLINDIITLTKNAINQHQNMAIEEGQKMADYIKESLYNMQQSLLKIEESFPFYKKELFDKLLRNMENLINDTINDDDRHKILVETSLKIDRSDITEEIVRLKSHIEKFKNLLDKNDIPLGKKFNFILQEMHREINTIGSKYNTNLIFDKILFIKEEIEKCREIIQNVE